MDNTPLSRRKFLYALPMGGLGLAACTVAEQEAILGSVLGATSRGGVGGGVSQADAVAGIRAALQNGVGSAITQVGRRDGFLGDRTIRIPLPGYLADLQSNLGRFGLSGLLDNLQTQINRGAEAAAPLARDIFVDAIRAMSIQDALGIVQGGPTSATDYFQGATTPRLTQLFRPVMDSALARAGAIQTFDQLTARLDTIPLAPELGANAKDRLIDHGVEKGLDGLFYYIGREEAAIRQNPARRTSEILRRVFG